MRSFAFFVFFLMHYGSSNAEGVNCEITSGGSSGGFDSILGFQETVTIQECFMQGMTSISSEDVQFNGRIEEARGLAGVNNILIFDNNENILYLPVRLHETISNLHRINAQNCSLLRISKRNFEKLRRLEYIKLDGNYIERIPSDTFEDLSMIREIGLSSNRIKFLNAKAFEGLPKLKDVFLLDNFCIDEKLVKMPAFLEVINQKCSFDESRNTGEMNYGLVKCENHRKSATVFNRDLHMIIVENDQLECYMQKTTSIRSDDVQLSDGSMEETRVMENVRTILNFDNNKKILFLPVRLYERISNLHKINAQNCALTKIFKKNFEKLTLLEHIMLDGNNIEKITNDTFEDLEVIREIGLSNNRIKFLNAKVFEGLSSLVDVTLKDNVCIDDKLVEMPAFLELINQQCSFDESRAEEETTSRFTETLLGTECGIVNYTKGFVKSGSETKRGQWPFLVALILTPNGTFFCGGNLISSKHVMTAAHCIHDKYEERQFEPNDIAILAGRHNVNATYERGSVMRDVEKIFVHPDWRNHTLKYDGDLAILLLSRSVEFSEYIKPVCLTNDAGILNQFRGTVVGWGKSDSEAIYETTPRQVTIKAVKAEVCFEQDPDLGKIYSRRSFCAGGGGAGPCTGDSGGGFFVLFKGRWTLKGVVSAGAVTNGGCDVSRYSLFTKMHDFAVWIKETTSRKSSEVKPSFISQDNWRFPAER